MGKILILGINGSPNKKGLCVKLLKEALKSTEKNGAKTKLVHLVDLEKFSYHSNYSRKPEKDFEKLGKEILEAEGIILATPVYWMNMSALMKNFIDKLTVFELQGFKLEGKIAGFISVGEEDGGWQTILNMAGPLSHMGLIFPPYSMVFYNKRFPKKSDNSWMTKDFGLLGKNVVELCLMVKSYKPNWDYKRKK